MWLLASIAAAGTPDRAARVVAGVEAGPPAAGIARVPADPVDPDGVTPEMAAWARSHAPARGTDDARVDALLAALSRRDGFGPGPATRTGPELFARGSGDCLSIAFLVVGLARELGVEAHYVRIRDLATPVDLGGTVVVAGHVAAAVGRPGAVRVVDPAPTTDDERRLAEPISDAEAAALYHVNRGARATLDGDLDAALAWFDLADTLAPDLPETWVDRGVALARAGRPDAALDAYRAALRADPWHGPAWRDLAALLASRGDAEGARATLDALSGELARDPFTRLALGDAWARVGDADRAARSYRAAAWAGGPSAAVRAARGELCLAAGEVARARRWLRRAEHVDPAHPRVDRLRRRLPPGPDRR